MPFFGGKTRFFLAEAKTRKQKKAKKNKKQPPPPPPKKKQQKNKLNKEGLGPSEVALWATSPDP